MRGLPRHRGTRGTDGANGAARAPFISSIVARIRSAPLRSKLVLGYAGTGALAILILGVTTYLYSVRAYQDEMTNKSLEVMRQISQSLETNVRQMDALVNLLYLKRDRNYEPIVQRLTGPLPDVPALLLSSDREFSSYLADVSYLRPDCTGITIRGVNGWEFSRSLSGPEGSYTADQAWYAKTIANPNGITVHGTHRQYYLENGRLVFSLSRQLVNPVSHQAIGLMMIDFDLSSIRDICQGVDLGEGGQVAICDDEMNVVYHSDEQLIMSRLRPEVVRALQKEGSAIAHATVAGERMLVIHLPSSVAGWRLVSMLPRAALTRRWRFIGLVTLMVGALMLTAMLGISLIIARSISLPIRNVNDLMRRVGAGEYGVRIDERRSDEIGQLTDGFNHMVTKIRELIQREYVSKLMEREAELKALQAQINPHFIHNTLELISTISLVKKVPEIDAVAMALSRMIRYSAKTADTVVPLGVELRHIEDYLSICRVRFENSVKVERHLETRHERYGVLRLTLQPLIENAVLHGFHESGRDGCITISARDDGKDLLVEVADDGAGMDGGRLAALRESLELDTMNLPPGGAAGASVGLRNVHARIALCFGSRYGITIESAQDRGTRVTMRVPARVLETNHRPLSPA